MAKPSLLSTAFLLSSLAASVGALVFPGPDASQQQPLRGSDQFTAPAHGSPRWPSLEELFADPARSAIDQIIDEVESASDQFRDKVTHAIVGGGSHGLGDDNGDDNDDDSSISINRPDDDQGHNHTIYQFISRSKYTTKFAELVDQHPTIVKLLNSTDVGNHTLFVPANDAFDHFPHGHHHFSKEFIESVLHYHIADGDWPAKRVLGAYTIPTTLNEEKLGDEPQRLRISLGLEGVKINFYSTVTEVNIVSTNGIIHAVDRILAPPPYASRIINLFPQYFSTLLLAYEKTNFKDFITSVEYNGITLFLPANSAWARLGPKANAFLFNTEKGKKYLKALLMYQLCPSMVLYSDAMYDNRENDVADTRGGYKLEHYDLPTYLSDARLRVDIARIFGLVSTKVNGFSRVIVSDGISKNGVIQVLDQLPIPPCKHHKHHEHEELDESVYTEELTGEIEVEDLMARLDPYLE